MVVFRCEPFHGRAERPGVERHPGRLQPFRLAMVNTLWGWMPLQDKLAQIPYRNNWRFGTDPAGRGNFDHLRLPAICPQDGCAGNPRRSVISLEFSGSSRWPIWPSWHLPQPLPRCRLISMTDVAAALRQHAIALLAVFSLWGQSWLTGSQDG